MFFTTNRCRSFIRTSGSYRRKPVNEFFLCISPLFKVYD
ncbi:hypothetical protein THOB06_40223 [Vibrio rotiferianus]|nr:hypothetical protein THOG10_40224 [Vibrio rotiferianus]CAH1589470.1 hypothetical protein THOB06_40223 [Vibrio rotiferianus]